MKCEKCMFCIQVSANEYKVKCASKKVAESKNQWIDEPSYCAFYCKGKYTDYIFIEEALTKMKKQEDAN